MPLLITGCDSGYGKTMALTLAPINTTQGPMRSDAIVTQVVSIVGQVAGKYGYEMDRQTVDKSKQDIESGRTLLCFYDRRSETHTGRLILQAYIMQKDQKLYIRCGKFHTSEPEKLVETVFIEIRERLEQEVGLRIVEGNEHACQ